MNCHFASDYTLRVTGSVGANRGGCCGRTDGSGFDCIVSRTGTALTDFFLDSLAPSTRSNMARLPR